MGVYLENKIRVIAWLFDIIQGHKFNDILSQPDYKNA